MPAALDAPLPNVPETPTRERLRWEKELLGLYLSDHPLGEIADAIGPFVTAYSGDLGDETLDGQRVVVGGIVTGVRMVVTKARATMAIVSLEDLQGAIEVVVFPRLYEETRPTWVEGRILLIAGRIDHKGEAASLLADLAVDWDDAVTRGPDGFARDVSAADRSRGRGRQGTGPSGNGYANGNGHGSANGSGGDRLVAPPPTANPGRPPVAVGPGPDAAGSPGRGPVPVAPAVQAGASAASVSPLRPGAVSPLRGGSVPAELPRIVPAMPVPADLEPADLGRLSPDDDEPPLPDEATALVVEAAAAPTTQLEAAADQVLHVRFTLGSGTEGAMETFRQVIRAHPGGTRVVLHVPGGRGGELPMELRLGVAYDAELLAEVGRRLGPGAVELRLA